MSPLSGYWANFPFFHFSFSLCVLKTWEVEQALSIQAAFPRNPPDAQALATGLREQRSEEHVPAPAQDAADPLSPRPPPGLSRPGASCRGPLNEPEMARGDPGAKSRPRGRCSLQ